MENIEGKKILEEITKEVLEKMGISGDIYIANDLSTDSTLTTVEIQSNDSSYLIGKNGTNLASLQHIIRAIFRRKTGLQLDFIVDVNGYKEGRKIHFIQLAKDAAAEAIREGKSVDLPPMNSFERRTVHMELQKMEGIKTESFGKGDERYIVVSPK